MTKPFDYEDEASQVALRYYKNNKIREEWLVKAKRFAYNKQRGTFFGRTPNSWFQLFLFYTVLFISIAIIWLVNITIFYQTIDGTVPKFISKDSLIGDIPGVGIRPRPTKNNINSGVISFKSSSEGNWKNWVDDINDFLKPYDKPGNGEYSQGDCDKLTKGERDPKKFCPFILRDIPNQCTGAQNYSYHLGKPCILVKLNRIYGWSPTLYKTNETPPGYPSNAPPLKEDKIQITCAGQSSVDRENIGPLAYYPQGIDEKYFPFTNQDGYLSPFVMVHFENPRPGMVIFVECKAWAKNIIHDPATSRGMHSFELLID